MLDRSCSARVRIPEYDLRKLVRDILKAHGDRSVVAARMAGPEIAEISFASKEIALSFTESGTFTVDDCVFEVRGIGSGIRTAYVRGLPFEMPNHAIEHYLSPFGKIVSIVRETFKDEDLSFVENCTRVVRIDLRKPLANLVKMGEFTARCEYPGVVRLCMKCGLSSHIAAECERESCKNCLSTDHPIGKCKEPCRICKSSQHKAPTCEKRSFAEVLRQGKINAKTDMQKKNKNAEQAILEEISTEAPALEIEVSTEPATEKSSEKQINENDPPAAEQAEEIPIAENTPMEGDAEGNNPLPEKVVGPPSPSKTKNMMTSAQKYAQMQEQEKRETRKQRAIRKQKERKKLQERFYEEVKELTSKMEGFQVQLTEGIINKKEFKDRKMRNAKILLEIKEKYVNLGLQDFGYIGRMLENSSKDEEEEEDDDDDEEEFEEPYGSDYDPEDELYMEKFY